MGAISKLQAYSFAILLSKDFKKWEAYKLGIINDKGEILRKPKTKEEKNSLDSFENLVRKLKIILLKFVPSAKYLSFIIAAYLLKEENNTHHEIFRNRVSKELSEEEILSLISYLKIVK